MSWLMLALGFFSIGMAVYQICVSQWDKATYFLVLGVWQLERWERKQ